MQKLFIITNEKIYENNNSYYCDNIDLKSTPEGLNKNFEVNLIARASKEKRSHKINIKEIKIFRTLSHFFSQLLIQLITTKKQNFY